MSEEEREKEEGWIQEDQNNAREVAKEKENE